MKLTAIIASCLLSFATMHGQTPTDLTHLLMKRPIIEHGVWQDDRLLINRKFADGCHAWSKDSLLEVFLPNVWNERDSLLHAVDDLAGKMAVRYHYANGLFDLSDRILYKMKRGEAWKVIADTVAGSTPIPDESSLAASPIAHRYLHHLVLHELREISLQYNEKGSEALTVPFGLPMDSLMSIAEQHGETFLTILLAKKCFPRGVHERYLAYRLMETIGEKDLLAAAAIRRELVAHFPTSGFLTVCNPAFDEWQETLLANTRNPAIVFLDQADDLVSLAALLEPFRGKVVYLDIWGTWCGPCVQEIKAHTPALKARFQHRDDLVFLYLAMDRDQHHRQWEQFVRLHSVVGFHLRKNETAMEPLWVDLLQTENVPRTYPTYAIFDRSGQLVTAEAMRPSHGEALYKQLSEVLGNAGMVRHRKVHLSLPLPQHARRTDDNSAGCDGAVVGSAASWVQR